ncbi:hypothetical protein KBZ18_13910 [Synechococcus sp. Cruz-9H2]|uniref:hypothetical protein n=1 Tax=unclassified Synechococcus TaxID=2626047 RepID=UPI0020CB9EA5|nr:MULTISPECIES: hypothetical protein [unclassified Synechococcus]MCP9820579.1 hypothetical protein [Synechococcus sp. Cruz-9H2]MCP9844784.1 hypothetical protein [Synechococcus sp. Edmonson 11F2]MCP9856935.1 hypothetical protein [Synechococcus sp. Cruz-9C9]MCP9864221.1 hypothetical protein [Synechococcus sp. Cruz-7E5]MCP9871461.1 hypothetical protein [Synechococcus sp. Cruz-7B9]
MLPTATTKSQVVTRSVRNQLDRPAVTPTASIGIEVMVEHLLGFLQRGSRSWIAATGSGASAAKGNY